MTWYGKIKILEPDRLFSIFIRTRDGWRCQYKFKCHGAESFEENKGRLQTSHFQKRGKWSVRYDPENADASCAKCHNFVENHPDGQRRLEEWKLEQLGEQRYNLLMIRAETSGKRDDFMATLYVKQLLKELEQSKPKSNSLLG